MTDVCITHPDIFRLMYWHALGMLMGPDQRNDPELRTEIALMTMYNKMYGYNHPVCGQDYSEICFGVLMAARRETLH